MIEVPFVLNPDDYHCAQASMAGVLAGFGARQQPTLEVLRELSTTGEQPLTTTARMALALDQLGLKIEYCNIATKEHIDAVIEPPQEFLDELNQLSWLGLRSCVRLCPQDFRNVLADGKPIIPLIDFRVFWKREGIELVGESLVGHFVTVIGAEGDNFILHQPGSYKPHEALEVNSDLLFNAFSWYIL